MDSFVDILNITQLEEEQKAFIKKRYFKKIQTYKHYYYIYKTMNIIFTNFITITSILTSTLLSYDSNNNSIKISIIILNAINAISSKLSTTLNISEKIVLYNNIINKLETNVVLFLTREGSYKNLSSEEAYNKIVNKLENIIDNKNIKKKNSNISVKL